MIFVILWEVIARYFFKAPTSWAHEGSTMLYGAYCILAGAYTQRFRAHVRSDAIYQFFPEKMRDACSFITGLLSIGFLAILLYMSFEFAKNSWDAREFSNASTWAPPVYPFKSMIPLATFLLLLQQIVTTIDDLFIFLGIKTTRTEVSPDATN
ncbi:MAG: TRAP transporter small permease subunit [Deltaproteobacteria bacterium]|nr:TRAP transporter small permease subunit [Deltaproteobacteria bacterium]